MPAHVVMFTMNVDVVINKDGSEYHAYCPALKGLHTCGKTKKETINNIKNAVGAYIYSLIKHNEPVPCCKIIYEDMLSDMQINKKNIIHQDIPISILA